MLKMSRLRFYKKIFMLPSNAHWSERVFLGKNFVVDGYFCAHNKCVRFSWMSALLKTILEQRTWIITAHLDSGCEQFFDCPFIRSELELKFRLNFNKMDKILNIEWENVCGMQFKWLFDTKLFVVGAIDSMPFNCITSIN